MENIVEFMKRAADKTGFNREVYIESKLPTTYFNLVVILSFGNQRSQFVLSTLFLHQYIKKFCPNKYVILCSWPGQAGLFPYASEYWSPKDEKLVEALSQKTSGFGNIESKVVFCEQLLNRYFESVLRADLFDKYYSCGFTHNFFQDFSNIEYQLPAIPAVRIEFARRLPEGNKVFLMPFRTITGWRRGKEETFICRLDFWEYLVSKLLEKKFTPVIAQGTGTYDLSRKFSNDCVVVKENKILDVLAMMRATGCVLDIFRGISRFAVAARCPFVACVEKELYFGSRDYELDDLCANKIPHSYIFDFATMIEAGNWGSLVDIMISRLSDFIPPLNRNLWPTTLEVSEVLPYTLVREKRAKLLGSRLIKVLHI